MASAKRSTIQALLIGVDRYLPNKLPGGYYYPDLAGCVRDVLRVEAFLKEQLGVPDDRIVLLTATKGRRKEPTEPRERWPTYENIVAGFRKVAERAARGDQVYIHYSGHGGRSPTAWPKIKGEGELDESLVPTDIGNSEAQYVRDVEIAALLDAMVKKGLLPTLVLDCCHSGGATRGMGGAAVRGAPVPDKARPHESLVGTPAQLAKTWRALPVATRGLSLGSGWLREPKGYVLLAACRASESAFEYPFGEEGKNGALTYWLLDSLKQLRPGLAYRQLHERIVAKVHGMFEAQTPQLEGAGDREFLGAEQARAPTAAVVLRSDESGKRLLVNAGQAQGLRKGAQLAIHAASDRDLAPEKRLALAEVEQLGATESWATVVKRFQAGCIDDGSRAVLVDPGVVKLRRGVKLFKGGGAGAAGFWRKLEAQLPAEGTGFVRRVTEGEAADFQVAVTNGKVELWDAAGTTLPNISPALSASDPKSVERVLQRLEHLARYGNVRELDNFDRTSPLAGCLTVELTGVQDDYDPVDRPDPRPFEDPGAPSVRDRQWVFLRIRNGSSQVLNVTALDLCPDWSIGKIFPSGAAAFEPIDPGKEVLLPLHAELPAGYASGRDVLKVLATVGTTDFSWLELPALDQPPTRRAGRAPGDALEQFLATVAATAPKTRQLNPATVPSRAWTAGQVELSVRRTG